jgi:hypothetical protein
VNFFPAGWVFWGGPVWNFRYFGAQAGPSRTPPSGRRISTNSQPNEALSQRRKPSLVIPWNSESVEGACATLFPQTTAKEQPQLFPTSLALLQADGWPTSPDFLRTLFALMNLMRLSLMKAAHAGVGWSSVQEIRDISLVFREMWDRLLLPLTVQLNQVRQGRPTLAQDDARSEAQAVCGPERKKPAVPDSGANSRRSDQRTGEDYERTGTVICCPT